MLLPVFVALAALAGRSDPPIKVTLNSDVYAVGEDAARVHVKVAQDGYIVILRADVDGRIRVLVPVDPGVDNFLRGGKDYDVHGRGDRDDTFQIEAREGTGTVLAAWSASPFTFDHFIRGDHWDYRVLGGVPSDQDAETVLLDVVREMAGEDGHFDYDVVHYQVASGGGGGYGHTHVAFGVGYGWGGWGYSPWSFGIGFGYGFGCWACWPYYGYGYGYGYPYYGYGYYPYGYYPYYPYYYGYSYPYGHSAYPYYLHSPYTFKPGGAGGPLVQPRPRSGGAFTAGFSGGSRSAPPRYSAPGFGPRTRTPAAAGGRVNQVDPRTRERDQQRMDAGQHRQPPPPRSQPRTREQPHGSGGSRGSGGQAQPRSRDPHQFSQFSETGRGYDRSRARSYSDRSYGGGFDRRQAPSSSYRGFSGGSFGNRGMSGARGFTGGGFGGRSSAPSSGGGFRGGGGGGARAPANGRHR